MITAVIFDCFGVLTTDLWKEFVATLPSDQRDGASDLNHSYDAGFISDHDFQKAILTLTGRSPGWLEEPSRVATVKNNQLLDFIDTLHATHKTGVISNIASNWIRDSLLTPHEQSFFDTFILSFEVGMTKPDERMFLLLEDRLQVSLPECIFVDDLEANCVAAKKLGMHTVLYQSAGQSVEAVNKLLADANH